MHHSVAILTEVKSIKEGVRAPSRKSLLLSSAIPFASVLKLCISKSSNMWTCQRWNMAEMQKSINQQHVAGHLTIPRCTLQVRTGQSETFMKLARGIGKKSVGIYPLAFAAIAAGTSYALGSDLHHSAKLSIGSRY